MNREFTRKELYELVWSRPMKNIAADLGISDVALAKHCRRATIPVPSRGYWARKQAGKPTIRSALPPRFPGASDHVGGSAHHHYWASDWPEKIQGMAVPSVPTFDEDLPTVEKRARKLVGKLQCPTTFEVTHPVVARLLAHDEERRQQFRKWHSSYYTPKYDVGIERRRLLIINTLFIAAANLGCSPSMSTSKYGSDSERQISIKIGESRIHFVLEMITSRNPNQSERLRLTFDAAQHRAREGKSFEDKGRRLLEYQLSDVFIWMLVTAEAIYRDSLIRNRQWVIESKARAEVELKRPYLVPKLGQLTRPTMGCRAGLHSDKARRQGFEERQYLAAPQLLPNDDILAGVDPVNLTWGGSGQGVRFSSALSNTPVAVSVSKV